MTFSDTGMNHGQLEMEKTYSAVFGWGLCAINMARGVFLLCKEEKTLDKVSLNERRWSHVQNQLRFPQKMDYKLVIKTVM